MKADKYIKILEENVLHYWPNLKSGLKGNDHPLLFQEDNAKAHVNKDTKKFFLKKYNFSSFLASPKCRLKLNKKCLGFTPGWFIKS